MRTYEVPGCAKLLLAENTPTHREIFDGYADKVLFSTKEECLKKILFLTINQKECESISVDIYRIYKESGRFLDNTMRFFFDSLR